MRVFGKNYVIRCIMQQSGGNLTIEKLELKKVLHD